MPPKIVMIQCGPKKPRIKFNNRRRNNERTREETLQRDNYVCQMCLEVYSEDKLECDHIIPLNQGGIDNASNTQTLCIPCHRIKTNSENVCSKQGITPTIIYVDEPHSY